MKKIEKEINRAFTDSTPNNFAEVEQSCKYARQVVAVGSAHRNGRFWKYAACALALVLVAAAVFCGVSFGTQNALAASVTLDVNPSITIDVNSRQKVVSITANSDGEVVLADIGEDLKGTSLKVAVYAIIGSMYSNGYLDELTNSVLVSVDSSENMYENLVQIVSDEIEIRLQGTSVNASVVSQKMTDDKFASELSSEYEISISEGKAQLIKKIAALTDENGNALYSEEQLVRLSTNELALILQNLTFVPDNIRQNGSSSEEAYIGSSNALQIALAEIGVAATEDELKGNGKFRIKLDFDDGAFVYEVEFVYNDFEYEFEINAVSGEVISSEKSAYSDDDNSDNNVIAPEELKKIALDAVGVAADSLTEAVRIESDNGTYTIKFTCDGCSYKVEISAASGKVISVKTEYATSEINKLTETLLKDAAFTEAGIAYGERRGIEVTITSDIGENDSDYEYEIKFTYNDFDYDIEIGATGKIVSFEKTFNGTPSGAEVTEETAKRMALEAAGVREEEAAELTAETENGVFEIEFSADKYNYEVEIDVATGTILCFEKVRKDISSSELTEENITEFEQIAIEFISANAEDVQNISVNVKDGKCEVTFDYENYTYEIEISLNSRKVIKVDRKCSDSENANDIYYSDEELENRVFELLNIDNYSDKTCEFTADGLEIAFTADGVRYEVLINRGGHIVDISKKVEKNNVNEQQNSLTDERAKELALNFILARQRSENVEDLKNALANANVESKNKDGVFVWKIEFDCNGYEYEIEINAQTGTVLDYERNAD